ncbi:MAG: Cys-tRNA(Pro) deacylase [Christensenellaceae bacterium]|nr:Cys-tRNA(Pro) deacylase [Christensenellaceae bacterium]
MKKDDKTNAIRMLEQKKLKFEIFDYSNSDAISGMEVAEYLHQDPNMVFKTLVSIGKSNNYYVFLVPVCKELDLKKAAKAVDEKNISMVKSKELLGLTGYIHGGCSPIGMKKFFKTTIDISAKNFDEIMFNGGKIGIQVKTALNELAKIISFQMKDIT